MFVSPTSIERLPPRLQNVYKQLAARAHGPGPLYLVKAMLPWLLPSTDRVLALDFDLLFNTPVSTLWSEFDRFNESQMIGVAEEFAGNNTYGNYRFGVNGGVQLLHLARMRTGAYERMLHHIAASPSRRIGYLGDQTLLTYLAEEAPAMFFKLSCRFNYQLNREHGARIYRCDDGCSVVHGNFASWKPFFRRWAYQNRSSRQPVFATELKRRGMDNAHRACIAHGRPRHAAKSPG